ncbi:ST3 beta-galactoside alpha-2,3-sialyltransferase 8 isoform X1 [Gadus morhua]|uniref:ST3 beta-galactoside alpha-2,3-sialyltransferase 8 isoform X1 n=1 Tax=Gadus morhua TaxID=8049 RepID=UPI0011B69A8A|nr:CMP-N-acetylneuraminate-beta-galactosamide-alpha-2,3-sialyltransferase 2-like isoform X1 [Gadus morhua]
MLSRRRLCVVAVSTVVLLIASQRIHRADLFLATPPKPGSSPNTSSNSTAIQQAAALPGQPSLGEAQAEAQGPGQPRLEQTPSTERCGCDKGCVRETDSSDWFRQHFDPRQLPVLNSTHILEPQTLSWWLGLQSNADKQKLEEVMSQLFQVIPPPSLDLRPLPFRCHSCAVVGNSGNLRHSGHGKMIDSHTSVFRMNKAVTSGFEEDVGNRTTHHFLYPESAVDIVGGASLVLLPFKIRDLQWLTSALSTGTITMTYMRVKDRVKADKDKVLVVNPEFFKYCHDHWTERHGRYPSTGLVALIFALHTCDQVSLYGYGADKNGNWHHYWEENRFAGAFRKTGVHSAEYETQIIQRLAQEHKITLHT